MNNNTEEFEDIGPFDKSPNCRFNKMVGCDGGNCSRCGHNPVVSIRRIKKEYGKDAISSLTPCKKASK